jgi:hypothetical protein
MPQPYDMAFAYDKWFAHLQRLVGPVDVRAAREMYEANLSVVEAAERLQIAA